jgi:hypothetical protein
MSRLGLVALFSGNRPVERLDDRLADLVEIGR